MIISSNQLKIIDLNAYNLILMEIMRLEKFKKTLSHLTWIPLHFIYVSKPILTKENANITIRKL